MRLLSLVTSFALLVTACSDEKGSSPAPNDAGQGAGEDAGEDAGAGGDGNPGDAGEFLPPPERVDPWDDVATDISEDVTDLYGALCARLVACDLQAYAVDETACVNALIGILYDCDKGLETVTLPELAACTDALTALPCEQLLLGLPNPPACVPALRALDAATGYALENEPCGAEAGCGTDLTCTSDGQSCGMCVPSPGPGEPCEGLCATGSVCTGEGACAALVADGLACASSSSCVSSYCNAENRCATPEIDDPCDADDACGALLTCVSGKCANAPLAGDACSDTAPCGGLLECVDGRCAVPGQCGTGAAGDTCTPLTPCAPGLICDANTSTCSALVAEGGACSLFGPFCDDGLACSGLEEGTCEVDTAAPGAACERNDDCVSRRCVSGVCSASDLGEECAFDSDCARNACDFGLCVSAHEC